MTLKPAGINIFTDALIAWKTGKLDKSGLTPEDTARLIAAYNDYAAGIQRHVESDGLGEEALDAALTNLQSFLAWLQEA